MSTVGKHFDLRLDKEHGFCPEQKLLCPICGFDFTHLEEIQIICGQDGYNARSNVRGDCIKISGYCEEGHHFNLILGQHKGWTFCWAERVPLISKKVLAHEI